VEKRRKIILSTSVSDIFPAACHGGTGGEYSNKSTIFKLSAAQRWVVIATFRQIYSHYNTPVPILQEIVEMIWKN